MLSRSLHPVWEGCEGRLSCSKNWYSTHWRRQTQCIPKVETKLVLACQGNVYTAAVIWRRAVVSSWSVAVRPSWSRQVSACSSYDGRNPCTCHCCVCYRFDARVSGILQRFTHKVCYTPCSLSQPSRLREQTARSV